MIELRIDPEFRDKLPPLTDEQFSQLRENILADGKVNRPLIAWHGALEDGEEEYDYLIDGHNRWKVIQEHPELPYTVEMRDFQNKWAAISWMYKNQKGQRNLSDLWQEKINAEIVKAEIKAEGAQKGHAFYGNQHGGSLLDTKDPVSSDNPAAKSQLDTEDPINSDKPKSTVEKVAKEIGVPEGTLKKQLELVRGLDAADEVSPGFQNRVLNGELTPTKTDVRSLRLMEPEERKEAVAKLESGKKLKDPVSMESMNATPLVHESEYNVVDFKEQVGAFPKEVDDMIRLYLLVHGDMVEIPECKAAFRKALLDIKKVADKYFAEVTNS